MRQLFIAFVFMLVSPAWAETRDPASHFFHSKFGDLRADLQEAGKQGKKGIFLFFEMDDCPFCERMKTTILNQSDVQDAYRAQFMLYPIDVNGDTQLTDFQGRPTTEKAFAFAHRVRATPTLLFFDLDGRLVARHTGPTRDKAEFLLLGRYVAEGAYATQPFTRYKQGKVRRAAWVALLACTLSAPTAWAERLTLEEALAAVAMPHPDRRVAESELALARADREEAASRQDFALFLDGSLRSGRRPEGEWKPDNVARLVARKPLLDFGRSSQAIAAAEQDIAARQAALLDMEGLRRIDIMARYFDVLLADMQYAADNEFMAVAYVTWDNAKDRFELGQISRPESLKLEAEYQDIRERRNASLLRMRSARQKLAHAINRPGHLPAELAEPALEGNARLLPEYDALLAWVAERNPHILALQAQLAAADARLAAIRAERRPTLDAEVTGGGYSRESSTRDDVSAGLVFNVPLHQGGRVDARIARELARKARSAAELERLRFDLADTVLATLQEIEWLRGSGRSAADKQIEYRDWALERARAEYELELKTNLGTGMAETQVAQLRRKQVEYRLALALARLEALSGGSLPPVGGAQE